MGESGAGHRQRLRERFLTGHTTAFEDRALLELLLTFAIPRVDVQPHAAKLLERFGALDSVLAADTRALRQVDGVGEQTIALLKLVGHLAACKLSALPVSSQSAPSSFQRDAGSTSVSASTAAELAEQLPSKKSWPQLELIALDDSSAEAPIEAMQAESDIPREHTRSDTSKATRSPRTRGTLMFSGSILADAISLLPSMPPVETPTEARTFFREHLRFNAAKTRERFAGFIVQRMFPDGVIDAALPRFAAAFSEEQELREVCFYRLCKAEPIMSMVVEDVLLPRLPQFEVPRAALVQYLRDLYPASKSIDDGAGMILRALADANIVRATPQTLAISYRPVLLPVLAFVLSSEFPPGIYSMSDLASNHAVRALLWDPSALSPALYELRNQGLISKVSEIDSVRQFTTWFTPGQIVDHLSERRVPR